MKGKKSSGRAQGGPPPRETTLLVQRILGVFLLCIVTIILLVLGINFFSERSSAPQRSNPQANVNQVHTQNKANVAPPSQPVKKQPESNEVVWQTPEQILHQSSSARAENDATNGPKYSFYEDLKKRSDEVQVELQNRIKEDNQRKVNGTNYRVQVGAFQDRDKADRMRARLILRDYPVQIINMRKQYLVQIGPYKSKVEAENIQKKVIKEGIKDTILKTYLN